MHIIIMISFFKLIYHDVAFKFEDCYKKLQQPQDQAGVSTSNSSRSTVRRTAGLLQRNAVYSDSDDKDNLSLTNDSESWPGMVEFDRYIQTVEAVSNLKDNNDLVDIVEW
jgi:hypothetical protein